MGDDETQILDVSYARFVEWLGERRVLPLHSAGWREKVAQLRSRGRKLVDEAVQHGSGEAKLALERSGYGGGRKSEWLPDYSLCCEIREELKEMQSAKSGGSLLSVFSSVSSTPLKEVNAAANALCSEYEKDNLHLGEAGIILVQLVDYDIPYLQKNQQRLVSSMADLERKAKDARRGAATAARTYKKQCTEMGVEPGTVGAARSGLIGKVKRCLPTILQEVSVLLRGKNVGEAIEEYDRFVRATQPNIEISEEGILPSLARVRACAHIGEAIAATALELQTQSTENATPPVVDTIDGKVNDASGDVAEIDWEFDIADLDVSEGAEAGEIDWDAGEAQDESGGIDWDIVEVEEQADEIDWDVGAEEISELSVQEPLVDSTLQEAAQEDKAEDSAVYLLSQINERNNILDDLTELKYFLLQRVNEMEKSGINATPVEGLQFTKKSDILGLVSDLDTILDRMTCNDTRHLLLMQSSPRYLARSAATIDDLASQEQRLLSSAIEMDTKRTEQQRQLAAIQPEMRALVSHIRNVKQMAEKAASAVLAKSRVNIIGEINRVLTL